MPLETQRFGSRTLLEKGRGPTHLPSCRWQATWPGRGVCVTFGNIRPVKVNHFSPSNPIFEVPRARGGQNDKFVAVGVPEAEMTANLIVFAF